MTRPLRILHWVDQASNKIPNENMLNKFDDEGLQIYSLYNCYCGEKIICDGENELITVSSLLD